MTLIRRSRLKQAYFTLLHLMGAEARLLRMIRQQDLLTVLNLHRVSPHANPFWNPLHPRIFEELLVFLKRHFHVTSFREWASSTRPKEPSVILSFDDGYYDFIEYAMPLLRKHGLCANQNIIPACVEGGQPPWSVRLYDLLQSAPRTLINAIRLPGFTSRLRSDDVDDKVRYGLMLSRFLKRRPQREREPLWQLLMTAIGSTNGFQGTRMMALADVQNVAKEHEVGVHSFSHESMGLESDAFFREDLDRCVAFFNNSLKLPLTIYAFPNGSYRPEQINILAGRGIEHILLVEDRFAKRGDRAYPRFAIYGESFVETRFQALGYNARSLRS